MEEWKEYKLGEIANFTTGKLNSNAAVENGKYPFFTCSPQTFRINDYAFDQDAILLAGNNAEGNFNIKRFSGKFNAYQRTYVISEKDKNEIDLDYLFYALKLYLNEFKHISQGTATKFLTAQILNAFPIQLPTLETQQKIAAILSSLDEKIELNNKINENIEQQAQALFKSWFVDNSERNGTICDYCDVKSGFAFKSSWWQDSGIKVIRIGDIEQDNLGFNSCAHVSDDKVLPAKDFIVKGGDLVIAMTGATIGKFSIVPNTNETVLVNQRVGKFFLGDNPVEKVPFIYCTLKQGLVISEFINRGQGSAQPNISTGDILSIPCWIPEKSKLDAFNKLTKPMFEKIISNQQENLTLANLRETLLPKLMSGELEADKLKI